MTKQQHTQDNRPTTSERFMKNIRGLEDALDRNLYRAAGVWLIDMYEYLALLESEANEYLYSKDGIFHNAILPEQE